MSNWRCWQPSASTASTAADSAGRCGTGWSSAWRGQRRLSSSPPSRKGWSPPAVSEALGLKRSLAFHLDDINKRHGVLGATMAVALGKSRVVELAVGTDAKGGKLHTRSLFAVASVTKLATALLTLRMVEQGKLDLKADVRQYLPAHLAWPGDKVTITHLLTHTAGVKRDAPDRADRAWVRSAYRCVRTAPSNPGQFFSYADCYYELLGITIPTLPPSALRRAPS